MNSQLKTLIKATSTPLSSIFGSRFLIIVPILAGLRFLLHDAVLRGGEREQVNRPAGRHVGSRGSARLYHGLRGARELMRAGQKH